MEKLIVLAFDGLSWNVLNDLFSKNKLKNIQKLIMTSASGSNVGNPPLISPKIWSSISTGKKGENHGIMDFYSTKEDLKSYQIWDTLHKFGYKVGIYRDLSALDMKEIEDFYIPSFYTFVKGSYPPKLSFIHDLDLQVREEREKQMGISRMIKTFWKLFKLGFPVSSLMKIIFLRFTMGLKRDYESTFHKRKKIEFTIHTKLFFKLIKRYKSDYSFLFENSVDSLCHVYWKDYEEGTKYSHTIPDVYSRIDKYIGKVRKFAQKNNMSLLIISDHGFATMEDLAPGETIKFLLIPDFLIICALEDDIWGVNLVEDAVFRVKPNSSMTHDRFKELFLSIKYENKPVFQIEELGKHLLVRIHDYVGSNQNNQKIELFNGEIIDIESIIDLNFIRTGLHSGENGVFIINGSKIKENEKIGAIKPYDIMPTILALLESQIPSDVDGRVLNEVFKEKPDVKFYEPDKKEEQEIKKGLSDDEEEVLKDRLRSLGYL